MSRYQERLKVLNAADFGDLLLECIRLFREQPEVLRQYQGRFRYILVDEYQDTNVAQYLWLRLLGQNTSVRGRHCRLPSDPVEVGSIRLRQLMPNSGKPEFGRGIHHHATVRIPDMRVGASRPRPGE